MPLTDNISQIFDSESQKLYNLFETVNLKTNMNIPEIIETYYQVMNVSSMVVMLKQQIDSESKELTEKIQQIENLISKKFDSVIHPKIMLKLSESIQNLTKNLQSGNSSEKSKEETESDAKLFDELRQTMSTKEFVEQYENGISHD